MKQRTIKVLFRAPLPTCQGAGKVASALERLVNLNVRHKFFTLVAGQRFLPVRKGMEPFNNGPAD